jgi:hypothetical protein
LEERSSCPPLSVLSLSVLKLTFGLYCQMTGANKARLLE